VYPLVPNPVGQLVWLSFSVHAQAAQWLDARRKYNLARGNVQALALEEASECQKSEAPYSKMVLA
jgi:hypothetical protein